jgi:outer membrane protein TolC
MGMVRNRLWSGSRGVTGDVVGPAAKGLHGMRGASFRTPVLTFLILSALCVTSCTTPNLVQIRHDNAALVLTNHVARPLAVVNNGRTEVTLHECINIALQSSLDLQAAWWEEQIRNRSAQASRLRMLPRVTGQYDLTTRDRPLWSRSDVYDQEGLWEFLGGPVPGTGVTNFSTARERFQRNYQIQMLWSPMDACMARYLSDIRSNEAVSARYQRVRVAQQLIGALTAAYYRLLALNHALAKTQTLEKHRRAISSDLGELARKALVASQEYLIAESQLAEARNQVAEMQANIGKQRELLAVAMNVCPDTLGKLSGDLLPLPPYSLDACKLEAAALVSRPEAYQADLGHFNSVSDWRRMLVKHFPRVEGFIGYFRDENKFLLNKNWIDGGMRITWDLMEFAANRMEYASAKDRVVKTDQERALVSLGIASQVRFKTLEAMKAFSKYQKDAELAKNGQEALRIATEVEQAKERGASHRLMMIAREKALCASLQAEVDKLLDLGEFHAALAELDAAVGSNYPVSKALEVPAKEGSVSVARAVNVAQAPLGAVKRAAGYLLGGILPR